MADDAHLLALNAQRSAISGGLYLLIAPRPAVDRLMDALAVRLALAAQRQSSQVSGEVQPYLYILDGGNHFDLHAIARGLAASRRFGNLREAPGSEYVEAILQRIQVARAFTCYQVEALLAAAAPRSTPVLAPRLLTTFGDGLLSDSDAPRPERLRLLAGCIGHLKRLAQRAPVVVSTVCGAPSTPSDPHAAGLLARLEAAADQVWRFDGQIGRGGGRPSAGRGAAAAPPECSALPATPLQLRLFGDRPGGAITG
jgi:hypothetical protein